MRQFKTTTIYSLSSVGIFAFLSVLLSGCDSADKKYECIDNYTGEVVKDDLCKEDSSSANIITSTTFIPNTSNRIVVKFIASKKGFNQWLEYAKQHGWIKS